MKIAFFTETFLPSTDGVVTRLTATIDQLLQMDQEVMVIAPGKGRSEYRGAPVVCVPGIPLIAYPEKQITAPHPVMVRAVKEFQPDVIHAVNPVNLAAYGVYCACKYNIPLISSYHTNVPDYLHYYKAGMLEPVAWKLIRWLHNKSQINLCTSEKMKEILDQKDIKNVYLWEKGVDTSKFGPEYASPEMRNKLSGGKPDKTIFLYVGRLGYEKELEKLRSALENIPEACLALVGDGPARSYLEDYFKGTDTVFTGYMHGEELACAYASADIFILPSTTETLGLVLLEAIASGIPAIAVDNGPPAEIVTDGVSGKLFSENGEPSIYEAMRYLAENPELHRELGQNALNIAREKYSWREPTKQLLEFYESAVNGWQG